MTLRERIDIQQLAETDMAFRVLHTERCRREPAYFINTCLNIFEPRETKTDWADIPYLLRGFQEGVVEKIKERIDKGEDLLIDKTREMGVTWLVLAVYLHEWLFDDKFTAIVSSITEQKIDHKDNPSCLLWKFDYMIDSLKVNAPYLWIEEYRELTSRSITHMRRYNPRNKSLIVGEVMGPNLGRSGRAKTIFLDEFAEAASPSSSFAASSRTSPCRIFVFTPKGMNFAGRLAVPKRGDKRVVARISLHWMIDPTKNRWEYKDTSGNLLAEGNGEVPATILSHFGRQPIYPWYADACARLGHDRVLIAQELDIDYNQSYEGQMYPQIDRARISQFVYDPVLPLYCSMDYGLDDMTALIWWQWSAADRRIRVLDAYQNRGKTIRWYIPFLTGGSLQLGESEGGYSEFDLEVIERHKMFYNRYTEFFGDPAGKQRNQVTATSVIQVLGDFGIYVRTSPKANANHVRKFALQCLLPYCDFNDHYTDDLVQAIRDSRLKPDGVPIHGPECLTGETQIRTCAGWVPLRELAGRTDFWVWGYSTTEKRLIPAKATACWRSGVSKSLIEVTLDDGHTIKTTPEHLFMLRDRSYKSAGELVSGDSLMPFYEQHSKEYNVIDLTDGSRAFEHRYVHHRVNGDLKSDFHVHHIDGNKTNNDPGNLELVHISDHCRITLADRYNNREVQVKAAALRNEGLKKFSKVCRVCQQEYEGSYKTVYCSKTCKLAYEKTLKAGKHRESWTEKPCVICGTTFTGSPRAKTCSPKCQHANKLRLCDNYNKGLRAKRNNYSLEEMPDNHRVVSVRILDAQEDVFDIEVPECRNFVANGVVVHNSHYRTAAEFFAVNQPHGLIGADGMMVTDFDLAHLEAFGTAPSQTENSGQTFADPMAMMSMWQKRAEALDELQEAGAAASYGKVPAGGWGRKRRR